MLEPLADGVWTAPAPLRVFTFAIGTRMAVVRLPDGGLLLHSPVPIDAALAGEIDALGPVRHVVCPNLFHHLFAGDALRRYPDALLHAPARLAKKRPDLRIDRTLGDAPDPAWGGAIETCAIAGSMLGETVLFHAASGTLVSADLLEHFERCDEAWTRLYLRAAGVYGRPAWNRLLRFLYRDHEAARRSIDRVLDWPIQRISVAHGEPVLHDACVALRDGFAWL